MSSCLSTNPPLVIELLPTGLPGPQGPQGLPGSNSNTLPAFGFSFGDASPAVLYTLPARSVISEVSLLINTPFNGTNPSLKIGIAGTLERLLAADHNDPKTAGQYTVEPGADLPANTQLLLTINPGSGASAGSGVILISLSPV